MIRGDRARADGSRIGAQAAASYNSLLRADPHLAQRSAAALSQAHETNGLLIHDRPLCNVLRPRFIDPDALQHLQAVSYTLWTLFERLGDLLLASDAMLDVIDASEDERSLWQVDPGYPGYTVTSRLDSFMVDGCPRFVEYNAESPASIGFCDSLTDIFLQLPVMAAWQHRDRLRGFAAREALRQTLMAAFKSWGGHGSPSVAIIDWEQVLTKRDFELCAEYFRLHGWDVVITDPRRLHYRSGALWSGNQKVNLIYRRVLLHELLEHAAEAHDLLQAYREGAVCMVNSPRSKLLHKKAVFALVSDPDSGLALDGDERSVVDATIPWTRLVRNGKTTYRGRQGDILDHAVDHQEQMVLKPSDDYGGRGVVLGWETSPDEWMRSLEDAVDQAYVLQERVAVPEYEFPVWSDDDISLTALYTDTDPLLFNGKLGGVLTRVSGSALLNVTAGTGSTAPTFLIEQWEDG
jgi:uncharacterized circularly permuted ATP-grasp superfamily protein